MNTSSKIIVFLITVSTIMIIVFPIFVPTKENYRSKSSRLRYATDSASKNVSRSLQLDLRRRQVQEKLVVASSHRAQHQFGAAEVVIRQAIAIDPKNGHLWSLLARSQRDQNNKAAEYQTRHYIMTTTDFGTSDTSQPVYLFDYAELCNQTGHIEEANQLYGRILQLCDGQTGYGPDVRLTTSLTLKQKTLLAMAIEKSFSTVDLSDSFELLRQLLEQKPGCYEGWYYQGLFYYFKQDWPRARVSLLRCIALSPAGSPSRIAALRSLDRIENF